MNLLLLLSALLSALNGAGVSARGAQPAVAVARPIVATRVERTTVLRQARPAVALPAARELPAITGIVWRLAPAAPLFLNHRRE